jgi:hypothetical protein
MHLVQILGGAEDLHWTDAPFPIPFGVDEDDEPIIYVQQWFSPGDLVTDDSGNQAMELVFPDVGRILRGLLYNESWSFRPATVYEVWLDAQNEVLNAYILADGKAVPGVANFEDNAEPVTLAIVPDTDAEGALGPAQDNESSCRYVRAFKGLQCGYAGAETACDGTFARCSELGMQVRYGGQRFAPAAGTVIKIGTGSVTVGDR